MENFSEIRLLHDKVQNDIFRILERYKVIAHVSSLVKSKIPLFYLGEDYKFMFYELPSEVHVYMASINRLLETGYLKIISDPGNLNFYLVLQSDLKKLSQEEQKYYILLSERNLNNLLEKQESFSFLDEIL